MQVVEMIVSTSNSTNVMTNSTTGDGTTKHTITSNIKHTGNDTNTTNNAHPMVNRRLLLTTPHGQIMFTTHGQILLTIHPMDNRR